MKCLEYQNKEVLIMGQSTNEIRIHEKKVINKWIPILVNMNYKGGKACELCLYCEYSSWEYESAMSKIFSWWGVMDSLGGLSQYSIDSNNRRMRDMENYKGELPQSTLPISLKILTKIKSLDDYNVEFDVLSSNELSEYVIDIDTDFEMDEKDFEYNKQVEEKIVDTISPIIDKKISSINKKDFSLLSSVIFNTKWLVKSYRMKDKKTISVTLSYGLIRNNG